MKQFTGILILLVCVAVGCGGGPETQDEPAARAEPAGSMTPEQISGEVLAAMDRSADPCRDFYRYACGGWLDSTERPADQATWLRSFSVVRERNREIVNEILEQAAANPGGNPERKLIGYYYGSCMNEEAIEKAGASPLHPFFAEIDSVDDAESLLALTGELHRGFIGALFGVQAVPDFANPNLNIAFFSQGGLGMPDRDYYVSDDETKRELMREYEKHLARMFGLLGEDEDTAAGHARDIVAFETELAKVSRDRTAMRQIEKLYNKIDVQGLRELTPDLPWDVYLKAIGYPGMQQISVATPEFFEALESLVASTDMDVIRTYLKWNVLNSKAGALSSDFVNADFDFYGKKVSGQEEIKPRWKRCVSATGNALGEAIGKLYVEQSFAGSSKEVALEMIHDIKAAFQANLPNLVWMDPTTRGRAVEKLEAMGFKIGYPDKWRDYSSIEVTPDDYFSNTLEAAAFEFDRQAKKIDNPVDRDEWLMTPQMVNAYNHPLFNEMGYPAGILQPPFFHRDFPAAMNYGAIGAGMGHELTHGYDDQGRKFNPQGQMEEWWEPQVAEKFEAQAECVDGYYSTLEIEPGVAVNGKLTLGENIADLGGLKAAFEAYKRWEQRHGEPEPMVEGLSNEQLLFVAWGQIWCTKQSDEQARLQVTTDPHSPGSFRASGPVSHNPAFARAFACEEETPMNPSDKCVVW